MPIENTPTLAELKLRGDNAIADTRQILRDMRDHVASVRSEAAVTVHGSRKAR